MKKQGMRGKRVVTIYGEGHIIGWNKKIIIISLVRPVIIPDTDALNYDPITARDWGSNIPCNQVLISRREH